MVHRKWSTVLYLFIFVYAYMYVLYVTSIYVYVAKASTGKKVRPKKSEWKGVAQARRFAERVLTSEASQMK